MRFQDVADIDRALRSGELSAHQLHTIWEQRQPVPEKAPNKSAETILDTKHIAWLQCNVNLARHFTAHALRREEFLLVCDAAREALRMWPLFDDAGRIELVRVRMDYAIALTRLGRLDEARRELEPHARADASPVLPPTLRADLFLRLGDIQREGARQSVEPAARQQAAQDALEFYERALRIQPDRLDALSLSAAASLVLGPKGGEFRKTAHARARQVLARAGEIENAAGPSWETRDATAVALVVLGRLEEAYEAYGSLASLPEKTVAKLAEARYWAEFLGRAQGRPGDYFRSAFPPLRLIVFSGHLPDLPGAPTRFPLAAVPEARAQFKKFLQEINVCVALCNAAAGADLLLIEALLEREGTLHLVLPWAEEEFRRTSIAPYEPAGGEKLWEPLFDRALQEAATLRQVGQMYRPDSDAAWDYVQEVTAGLALHTARMSRLDIQPVDFWDGQPGRGAGGTASFHSFWRQQLQQEPLVLTPPHPSGSAGLAPEFYRERSERDTLQQQVKTMLFADIVGYSKLMEKFIPRFAEIFMARVSRLAAASAHAPRSVNTWGDAIYAVFDYARDAGCFALELLAMIKGGEEDWLKAGLYWEEPAEREGDPPRKHPLNIRIGLHTGPVFIHYDPVVRHLGFTGTHVSRAARIEPVAAPGEVYASEEFVALAELDAEIKARNGLARAGQDFACEYAGTMQLAKKYPGRYRIYRLVPAQVIVLEDLAKIAHAAYCIEAGKRGENPLTNPAMRPWDELDEDFRQANRAQVADIANKLRTLGYELTAGHGLHPSQMVVTPEQLENMSVREHDRWMKERMRQGWTYGVRRDDTRKLHPMLVGWGFLSESERDKDRETVRNLPLLIERTGFRIKKIENFVTGTE